MRTVRFAAPALALVAVPLVAARISHAQATTKTLVEMHVRFSLAPAEASGFPATPALANTTDPASLPDSPSFVAASSGIGEGQSGHGGIAAGSPSMAKKWSTVILPGQSAQPLSSSDKVSFAFRQTVSPFSFLSVLVSATYSQAIDSAPHYGQGWGPYGQRIGAAAARNTVQTLAGQALFAPLFHDDPRYYQLGREHKLVNRAVYAATRVVVTRSDSGRQRINIPLLASYAVAAGVNNAFYPERDRGGKDTAISYASSLGGAVAGMEVSEFLSDALRIAHLPRFSR